MVNFIICTTTVILAAYTGQAPSKQTSTEIIAGLLPTNKPNQDTNQIGITQSCNIELTRIYSQAIADFITEVSKQDLMTFDTLFFGKRNNGQPDDFPNIVLPKTINNIKIRLIDPEIGKKLQEKKRSRVYINLIGWVEKDYAEFVFVTFTNGFEHKFDCHIEYKYNSGLNKFRLTKSKIEIFSKK